MGAFLMLYETDSDVSERDDQPAVILGKSRIAERRAFTQLSSVCSHWYQSLIGWIESPTSQWLKHQIKKLIERKYTQLHTQLIRTCKTTKIIL